MQNDDTIHITHEDVVNIFVEDPQAPLIYIVLVGYSVALETKDAGWALDFYRERLEEHKGTTVNVDLTMIIQRNGGEVSE